MPLRLNLIFQFTFCILQSAIVPNIPLPSSNFLYLPLPSSTFLYLPLPSSTFLYLPLPSSTFLYLPLPSSIFLYLPLPSSTFLYHPLTIALSRCTQLFRLFQRMNNQSAPQLGFKPCGFWGHDIAGIGNIDKLLHGNRIQSKSCFHFTTIDTFF